jgi:hypothetical protein
MPTVKMNPFEEVKPDPVAVAKAATLAIEIEKPFFSAPNTRITTAEYLAKTETRIVAERRMVLDDFPVLVWAWYAGHEKKIFKAAINTDHPKFGGRVNYADTRAGAQKEFDLLVGELLSAGAK